MRVIISGGTGLIGLDMRLMLPLLFAYRRWKTKRLLERSPTGT
jgi:hypothetical protein